MKDPDVKTAIKDLLASEGLTRRYRIRRLKDHINNRDPNVSLKGLDMSFRLDGGYAPEKHMVATVSYQEISKARQENIEKMKSLVSLDPSLIKEIPQEILDEHPEIQESISSQTAVEENNGA
jgi:hypothetical protein